MFSTLQEKRDKFKISFKGANEFKSNNIYILINDKLELDTNILSLDKECQGIIQKVIENGDIFKGKWKETKSFKLFDKEGNYKNIILVGINNEAKKTKHDLEQLGGFIHKMSTRSSCDSIDIYSKNMAGLDSNEAAAHIAFGAKLAAYRFDKYQTQKTEKEKFITNKINLLVDDEKSANQFYKAKESEASGVYLARDLVSELPNYLYPETYANLIKEELEPLGVKVTIYGEAEMQNLGMNALLGVGQGSSKQSQMVVMEYYGSDDENEKPVSFVGKGVTFDTGGISLKPSGGMHEMKYDMGGSAAVVGAMKTIASRKAKHNVVSIVGLAENMPGSNAQRPGDVVKTMSGQTVEVLNTDAEGRLVLCDCLTFLQKNFTPEYIVDLATLTGAIIVCLGNSYGGCFSNNDKLVDKLINAGKESAEKLWNLPLDPEFDKMINSSVADIANIGGERGSAGSSTAAHFLARFIEKGNKWAHLDIAGMAWNKKHDNNICPAGASGYGVRLLNQFLLNIENDK